jgi:hypothetical protein
VRPTPPAEPAPTTSRAPASAEAAAPAPIANHDPQEWVARFIGDKGPLQIGSQAMPDSSWMPTPPETSRADAPGAAQGPKKSRGRKDRGRPRSRASRGHGLGIALTGSIAAIVVVATVVLMMRAGVLARNHAAPSVAIMTAASESHVARPRASSKPAAPSEKEAEAPQPAAAPAVAAPQAAPVEEHRAETSTARPRSFTIDVGGAPDLDTALARRDHLQQLTGIEGWVVPGEEGGAEPYRIVLGMFRSEDRATSASNMLLNSRTLTAATVVPLPPRRVRQ